VLGENAWYRYALVSTGKLLKRQLRERCFSILTHRNVVFVAKLARQPDAMISCFNDRVANQRPISIAILKSSLLWRRALPGSVICILVIYKVADLH